MESLQHETRFVSNKDNLSRLREIAKSNEMLTVQDIAGDYVTYLTEK
ncbi:MAG: hypothetical protein ACHBN1_16260 [Heteroscytonema crispum UTEX LB 1556]